MKKVLLLLWTSYTFAITGVVRVLEAPLLREGSIDSKIIQKVRMGNKIFINENSLNDDSFYYKTTARDGTTVYVKKEYIKIKYQNLTELNQNIHLKVDPTNYLLEEPVPQGYPLKLYTFNKASLDFSYEQSTNSRYEYSQKLQREQFNPSIALSLKYLRNPKHDFTNRLYYGFNIGIKTERNNFQIGSDIFSTENHLKLYIGPSFQYTIYRRQKFEVDFNIDASFNLQDTYVKQEDLETDEAEELGFSGQYISAHTSVSFVHKKAFDVNDLSIIHGPSLTMNTPYSLKMTSQPELVRLWPTQSLSVSTDISMAYRVGFTVNY